MNTMKLNPDKTDFLIGNEWQERISLCVSSRAFRCDNKPHQMCSQSWGVIFDENSTLHSHISVVCSSCFTTFGMCSVFADTWTWTVHTFLFMLCQATSITAIHFSLEWQTPQTSPNFSMSIFNCPML